MDLHKLLFELMPAIAVIYEFGLIPEEDDIHELLPELYSLYESKGNDTSERQYTVAPKNSSTLPYDA